MANLARRRARTPPYPFDLEPSQARGKLGMAFLHALANDFRYNGAKRIAAVSAKRPLDYLKLVAKLLPKEFWLKQLEIRQDEAEELLACVRAAVAQKKEEEAARAAARAKNQQPSTDDDASPAG
jgi:hypothetical protein